jgi:hypothetical protein
MMIQLCDKDADCTGGKVCLTFPLMMAIKVCQMGDGGSTTTTEGGATEGGATEAGSEAGPTEAGPTDAAGGG